MLSEEEVYNGAKRWLQKNGYQVIAGQPARGVDHLPVVEIKRPTGNKGSRNAYKPDLIAYRDGRFFIMECKPLFDLGDLKKLNEVLTSSDRLAQLYAELDQYHLLQRVGYGGSLSDFCSSVSGILAFSGAACPTCPLSQLIVADWKGSATLIP